jgi:hypothetical protein
MNVKEGMRRLALLIGILGAAIGCFASYVVSRDTLSARERHRAFEQLATSDVVQQERKALQEEHESWFRPWVDGWEEYRRVQTPPKDIVAAWKSFSPEHREELLAKMTPEQKHNLRTVIEQQMQKGEQDPYGDIAMPSSSVNKGGIRTIVWKKDYRVYSIETEDGATLYQSPAPTRWPFLLAAILPVLGFFVPWASVRVLAWVGIGFFEKSE